MASSEEEQDDSILRRSDRSTRTKKFDPIGDNAPIYVISKIPDLDVHIKNSARAILNHSLNVSKIEVPDDNDFFCDKLIARIATAEVVVIDPPFLQCNHVFMPALKWAHCTWAGVENLFESIAQQPQFVVTRHGGDKFTNLMAEYVVGNIFAFERNFIQQLEFQSQKVWSTDILRYAKLRSLDELSITVLGTGNMGKAVAKFLRNHGSTLCGFSRTLHKGNKVRAFFNKTGNCLDEYMLAEADYIVNTLPSTPETVELLKADTFKICLKKPIFINAGRGDIIAESELVTALENGILGGAVLDVFRQEPLPHSSQLWNMKNVIITPHCAAVSKPEHIAENFIESFMIYKQNLPLPNMVDWEKGY